MPTLEFKGKQHIYAHHLTVPYRPLEPDETRSCNPTDEYSEILALFTFQQTAPDNTFHRPL